MLVMCSCSVQNVSCGPNFSNKPVFTEIKTSKIYITGVLCERGSQNRVQWVLVDLAFTVDLEPCVTIVILLFYSIMYIHIMSTYKYYTLMRCTGTLTNKPFGGILTTCFIKLSYKIWQALK